MENTEFFTKNDMLLKNDFLDENGYFVDITELPFPLVVKDKDVVIMNQKQLEDYNETEFTLYPMKTKRYKDVKFYTDDYGPKFKIGDVMEDGNGECWLIVL